MTSATTKLPGKGREETGTSPENLRNSVARRVLGATAGRHPYHFSGVALRPDVQDGGTADGRTQGLKVRKFDRHLRLQRLGPIYGPKRGVATDLIGRTHKVSDLDIRCQHAAGVGEGYVRPCKVELRQLQFRPRLRERAGRPSLRFRDRRFRGFHA